MLSRGSSAAPRLLRRSLTISRSRSTARSRAAICGSTGSPCTPAQVDRLLHHAWELGSTYLDYFYVGENCSYHILSLIEVARPELDFRRQLHWQTVPVDTLRLLLAQPGLIAETTFRPSLRRR